MNSIASMSILAGIATVLVSQGTNANELSANMKSMNLESGKYMSAEILRRISDPEAFINITPKLPNTDTNESIYLSDEDAVNATMINSQGIKSAVYQYQEQIYRLRAAYSSYYPSLSLYNTSTSWSQAYEKFEYGNAFELQTITNPFGMPTTVKVPASVLNNQNLDYTNTYNFNIGLQLSYKLIDPQRDLNIAEEMKMKEYYYNMIIEEIKDEYQTVSNNLLNVKINTEYASLYSQAADYAKNAYQKIVESYQGGFSTKLDVDNYLAQYLSYEAQKISFLGKREQAISDLLESMGWPQNINITLREPLAISEKWPIGTDDSIKMGIENNERIKNLSIQSQKAYIKAQNELYGYIPVIILNLIGTANKGKGEVIFGWPYSSSEYRTNAAVSVGMQWSIFDGFKNINASRSYKKAAQSFERQKENEKLSIENKIASRISSQSTQLKAYRLNKKASNARKELTELTSLGVMSGYNTVFNLIKAQQDAVESVEATIRNAEEINQNYIDLQRLTGIVSCNIKKADAYCKILKALAPNSFRHLNSRY